MNLRLYLTTAIALLLLALPMPTARGQVDTFNPDSFDPSSFGIDSFGVDDGDPVTVEAQFTAATANRPAVLMISATVQPLWHVYSITQPKGGPQATKIKLNESDQYQPIGDWRAFPEPRSHVDTVVWNGLTIEEHDDQVTWYLPIKLADGVRADQLTISGKVSLQACKESCIPLKFNIAAKLGQGVKIGPVTIAEPTNVVRQSADASKPTTSVNLTPPPVAGVYRADGSEVTWYAWLEHANVQPGGRTHLLLRAELPTSWHVNAYAAADNSPGNKPTLIAMQPSDALTTYQPEPRSELIEKESPVAGFGKLRYHEGAAVWAVPIDVSASASVGRQTIEGFIGYQACESNEQGLGSCELSKGARFVAAIQVGPSATGGPAAVSFEPAKYAQAATLSATTAGGLKVASQGGTDLQVIEFSAPGESSNLGLISVLGAAVLGGLILNLMPCVLPVIGLKIMSFAKQGGESRLRVFLLNLAYVFGLLMVFMLLATLASLTQFGLASEDYGWGQLNTQLWFKVSMTVLVFVMALSFLGVWEIPLPGFAGSSSAAQLASREGYGGAFFKGVLTTILATPCSGPFLGPVFGYTIGQPPHITYLIFLFVGLGMALPYLLIGVFPALVRWIPKPGMWMETFKQLMAFVLLGTVVYLLSTIGSDSRIATLALLVACWFACWLGGRQPITAPLAKRSIAWFLGLTTAVGVGLVGFAPEPETTLPWKHYTPAQLSEAKEQGKIVLVDFTADWCLTCKWNLAKSIDVAAVQKVVLANKVEALKADWTDEDEAIEQALEQLHSRSIPLLAIYPADRPDEVIVLRDTVTQKQVLQALAEAGAAEANPHRDFVLRPEAPRTASNSSVAPTPFADPR